MIQSDRALLYETLNHCTQALNEDVATGMSAVYVTVDRLRFNALLKEIAEAKKMLVRPEPTASRPTVPNVRKADEDHYDSIEIG